MTKRRTRYPCTNPRCLNQHHFNPVCPNFSGRGTPDGSLRGLSEIGNNTPPISYTDGAGTLSGLLNEREKDFEFIQSRSLGYIKVFDGIAYEDDRIVVDLVGDGENSAFVEAKLDEGGTITEVTLTGWTESDDEEREVEDGSPIWLAMESVAKEMP